GQLPLADPHPDERVQLGDRVGGHPCGARNPGLAGHEDAAAALVVGETVVAADDLVAVQPALRQRVAPVHTPVGQCDDLTGYGPVEHDGLTEDGPGEQPAPDLT